MKSADIKEGETYIFVSTDSPARKYLEGQDFKVVRIDMVFRRLKIKGRRKVKRFFNEDNVGARAEELEPRDLTDFWKEMEAKMDPATGDWLVDTASTLSETPVPPERRVTTTEEPPPDDLPF